MIANLLVVLFVFGMIYFWGFAQGAYQALLHLLVVVVAASLAVALWEPLAIGYLLSWMGDWAWGLALLIPFIGLALLLQGIMLKLAGKMTLPTVIDIPVGSLLGLLAGMLAAGVVVIGASMLPVGTSDLGVLRLQPAAYGQTSPAGVGLWIPVDSFATGLLNRLSAGSFSSRSPLWLYRPALATQSQLFRLADHSGVAPVIEPDSVQATAAVTARLPLRSAPAEISSGLGDQATLADQQLVVISTRWTRSPHTFQDGSVRVVPAQIRLVTWDAADDADAHQATLHAPVAITRRNDEQQSFLSLEKPDIVISGDSPPISIGWAFVVPRQRVPKFLMVRQVRLMLPEVLPVSEAAMLEALGQPPAPLPKEVKPAEPVSEIRSDVEAAATALLPRPIASSQATDLEISGDVIVAGNQFIPAKADAAGSGQIKSFRVTNAQRVVRVRVQFSAAQSLFGKAVQSATMLSTLALYSANGDAYEPVGYVLLRPNGDQTIQYDPDQPLRYARQLPLTTLKEGEELFVYYQVEPSQHITSLRLGSKELLKLNVKIPD